MNCIYQKCFGGSCSTGDDADIEFSFCGNRNAGVVEIGACGICQLGANGEGGSSTCNNLSTDRDECPSSSTCPTNSVCCDSGICALEGREGALGENCPDLV